VPTIVSIHSFRGGTGKSNTTANVARILAGQGRRVDRRDDRRGDGGDRERCLAAQIRVGELVEAIRHTPH
jgi:MinD-like ATPase involved in chromosome partitioning or flagellar assembly